MTVFLVENIISKNIKICKSLKSVAEEFNLSHSYLSNVKASKGNTFICKNYLIKQYQVL